MLKESVILIRSKILVDLIMIGTIIAIIQSIFHLEGGSLIYSPFFAVIVTNILTWFVCARAFGLYGDLRLKPFSIEWVMFLKHLC